MTVEEMCQLTNLSDVFQTEIYTGKIYYRKRNRLKTLLAEENWRDPDIIIDACDGVAWQMELYSSEGEVINTSGPMGYIYGHRILEEIVYLLPSTNKDYGASAYVSVKRKNSEKDKVSKDGD